MKHFEVLFIMIIYFKAIFFHFSATFPNQVFHCDTESKNKIIDLKKIFQLHFKCENVNKLNKKLEVE